MLTIFSFDVAQLRKVLNFISRAVTLDPKYNVIRFSRVSNIYWNVESSDGVWTCTKVLPVQPGDVKDLDVFEVRLSILKQTLKSMNGSKKQKFFWDPLDDSLWYHHGDIEVKLGSSTSNIFIPVPCYDLNYGVSSFYSTRLAEAFKRVLPGAATDDYRPVLQHIQLSGDVESTGLEMTASDSYSLFSSFVSVRHKLTDTVPDGKWAIPFHAARSVWEMCSKTASTLTTMGFGFATENDVSKTHLRFETETETIRVIVDEVDPFTDTPIGPNEMNTTFQKFIKEARNCSMEGVLINQRDFKNALSVLRNYSTEVEDWVTVDVNEDRIQLSSPDIDASVSIGTYENHHSLWRARFSIERLFQGLRASPEGAWMRVTGPERYAADGPSAEGSTTLNCFAETVPGWAFLLMPLSREEDDER